MRMVKHDKGRTVERIRLPHDATMDYAPENEQGVIFLFADLARSRWGMRVESIQAGFPDCVAYQRGKRRRIEFELKSSNFRLHRHNPKQCDILVCWIDDWIGAPPGLEILELRREFRMGFNVWIQAARGQYREQISAVRGSQNWSVARQARKGDLVLFYRASPDRYVSDIFEVVTDARHQRAGWKAGKDWMAAIRRVARLDAPLHWEDLQRHHILKYSPFVRRQMHGRHRATEYWPTLRDLIVRRNPTVTRNLKRFGPERVSRG